MFSAFDRKRGRSRYSPGTSADDSSRVVSPSVHCATAVGPSIDERGPGRRLAAAAHQAGDDDGRQRQDGKAEDQPRCHRTTDRGVVGTDARRMTVA